MSHTSLFSSASLSVFAPSVSSCPCHYHPKCTNNNLPFLPSFSVHRRHGRFACRISFLRFRRIIPNSSLPNHSASNGFVDVIGIGSRKDAVIDHCLQSPFTSASSRLRFWTIDSRVSHRMQLLQREIGDDLITRIVEYPLFLRPCPLATILVASAGYGLNDISALELLPSIKSDGGLVVAVLLMPFRFEGQRRRKEVENLVDKLQKCSHLHIVVETDALLKTEDETLAEAIRIVNNAILASINMISVLFDDVHLKFLDTVHEEVQEVIFTEILKLYGCHGETAVGYGTGYDIKSSISQAVFNCPFLTTDMKHPGGMVVLNIASERMMDKSEVSSVIRTFRRVSQCNKHMVFCSVHESALEQNLVITTLLVISGNEHAKALEKSGFLSSLVHHFPTFFSILTRDHSVPTDHIPNDWLLSGTSGLSIDGLESLYPCEEREKEYYRKKTYHENKIDVGHFESKDESASEECCEINEDENLLKREQINSWIFSPDFRSAQLWAEERTAFSRTTKKIGTMDAFSLPVGVKFPHQTNNDLQSSEAARFITLDDPRDGSLSNATFPSLDLLSGANLEAAMDIYSSTLKQFKSKSNESSKKQGSLSTRATSMLDAERESGKKWTPIIEMKFRGGLYRGRCEGGLPEGKGRLTFTNGSFYDGILHYGKRSGFGMFYFSNGDVYQGTWRDDLMHGKGWFYFHSGDRWFANFWKGKANGEGRFYSKLGGTFFGHFQNGWRHGEFLCIGTDGTRWKEIWKDGVLSNQTKIQTQSSD
ncbi:hypothetical protein ZOSMA_104G00420 [Zostera marina]|uniref:Protein ACCUMULATION AND REPLICATION OF CHLOROPLASTS 3 n=1 Tax=Zostera marina TaxID=29655 RepID=A0A0K9Q531_ZOSMR|nr:hypothetical protein ZOSMA_104G00420 [Zostera marina]